MLYRGLKGVGAAELRIYDDQANRPVHDDCEGDEEDSACHEACVPDGVGLTDYTSTTT